MKAVRVYSPPSNKTQSVWRKTEINITPQMVFICCQTIISHPICHSPSITANFKLLGFIEVNKIF